MIHISKIYLIILLTSTEIIQASDKPYTILSRILHNPQDPRALERNRSLETPKPSAPQADQPKQDATTEKPTAEKKEKDDYSGGLFW